MAHKTVKACIQRVEDVERQALTFSTLLAETKEDLNKALEEIMSGVNGNPSQDHDPTSASSKQDLVPKPASPEQVLGSSTSAEKTLLAAPQGEPDPELPDEFQMSQTQIQQQNDLQAVADDTAARLGIASADVLRAYAAFSKIDVDSSGKVSTTELHKLLEEVTGETLTKTAVANVLKKFDKDSDGELDFEEFLFCFCYTPAKKMEHLKAALYNKSDALDDRFRTRMVGVNANDLKKYLQKELDEEQAFLQIPQICLLFVFFLIAASMHRMTAVMNSVERAVEFDIMENANFAFVGAAPFENGRMGHKGIVDINSFADFWSWLDLGLGPLFFPSGWSTSEARSNVASRCTSPFDAMAGLAMTSGQTQANTPYGPYANASYASVTGDLGPNLCNMDEGTSFPTALGALNVFADSTKAPYLYFNEIIAGVRLRQEQLPEVECSHPDYFQHAYSTPCIAVNHDAWLHPDLDMILPMDDDLLNKPGGESVYFRSGMDLKDVHREIRILENKRWVNQRTGKIEVTFATYNNHIDMFVGVYINFFISRAGHIHKIIKPVSFDMKPYSNPASYVIDGVFALLVLQLFLVEGRQICLSIKSQGFTTGLKTYFYDFKNVVDWTCLGWSTFVFVLWAKWCMHISELGDILLTGNTSVKGSWESGGKNDIYTPSNAEFWETVDEIAQYDETMQIGLAFYPILLGLRFFSAFSAQPRLAIVTKTLACAASDLLNFGVVMGVTLMTFCASAVMLFGREVEEFENFGRAFVTVCRGTLGDLDYEDLTRTGRFTANVWWSVFTILANCVMLNMVLAIIMDAYSSVKESMGNDLEDFPTIWTQADEIFRRWRKKRKGLRVSLGYLVSSLEKHDSEEWFTRGTQKGRVIEAKLTTVSKFMSLAPGLGHDQAERLLGSARNYFERQGACDVGFKDVLVSLRGVDLKLQQVYTLTDALQDTTVPAEAAMRLPGPPHLADSTHMITTPRNSRTIAAKMAIPALPALKEQLDA